MDEMDIYPRHIHKTSKWKIVKMLLLSYIRLWVYYIVSGIIVGGTQCGPPEKPELRA